MSDLTPENRALMDRDPQNALMHRLQCDYTPPYNVIQQHILKSMQALVIAEEYGHPLLSRDEAIRLANQDLDLGWRALKANAISAIKTARGEWIVHA